MTGKPPREVPDENDVQTAEMADLIAGDTADTCKSDNEMEPMIRADKRHGRRYISEGARGAGVHLATNTPSNSTSDQQYALGGAANALGGAANALGGAAHEHDTVKTADGVEEQLHQTSAACRASDYRKTGTLRQEGVRSDDTTDLTASRANGASHTETRRHKWRFSTFG